MGGRKMNIFRIWMQMGPYLLPWCSWAPAWEAEKCIFFEYGCKWGPICSRSVRGPLHGRPKNEYFSNMDANGTLFAPVVFVGPCMGGRKMHIFRIWVQMGPYLLP